MVDDRTAGESGAHHELEGPLSQRGETIRDSGLIQRQRVSPTALARVGCTDAEIAANQLDRAYDLLRSAHEGTAPGGRAVAAGEARDLYESAMGRVERLRGAQGYDLLEQAWRVWDLLQREADGRTWPP